MIFLEFNGFDANTIFLPSGDVAVVGLDRDGRVVAEKPGFERRQSLFMLINEGNAARIIDFGSKTGTFVDGKRVNDGYVNTNSIIESGENRFFLFLDRELGKRNFDSPLTTLIKRLKKLESPLYGIVDAARDEGITKLLLRSNGRVQSLYQGEAQRQMSHVAPYLVEFRKDDNFLERIIRAGWAKRWCTFFTSEADFGALRKHLRYFLFVKNETDETVYFRFYDPSIMRVFLPACSKDELIKVFGPINGFYVEDDDPSKCQRHIITNDRLKINVLELAR